MKPTRTFADWFSEVSTLLSIQGQAVNQREAWTYWAMGLSSHQAWLKFTEGTAPTAEEMAEWERRFESDGEQ